MGTDGPTKFATIPTVVSATALADLLRRNQPVVVLDVRPPPVDLPGAVPAPPAALARWITETGALEADAFARGIMTYMPIARSHFGQTFGWMPNAYERIVVYGADEAAARAGAAQISRLLPDPLSCVWGDPAPFAAELARHATPERARRRPPGSLMPGARGRTGLLGFLRRIFS